MLSSIELPSLLSPSLAETDLPRTPALVQLLDSPALADAPVDPPKLEGGARKRVRRTLDTSAGALLTGEATMALLRAVNEAAETEAAAKKQRVVDRVAKKAEREAQAVVKKAEMVAKKTAKRRRR